MANTIAACVGSKDIQSLVACPCSIGKSVTGSTIKFNRREMQDALRYIHLDTVYMYVCSTSTVCVCVPIGVMQRQEVVLGGLYDRGRECGPPQVK